MSSIVSLDHEIMSLPFTGGMLCGHQMSQRSCVIIKVALLGDICLSGILSFLVTEKLSPGPLGNIASERLQPCD